MNIAMKFSQEQKNFWLGDKLLPVFKNGFLRSSRTFQERFKEHQKAPSPIYDHYNTTGHNVTIENFSIVGREDQNLIRAIKEAIYIRVNNPSLYRNRQIPSAIHIG